MVHETVPVADVTPLHVCAVDPLPSVKVTVRPARPEPGTGLSVVSTPETLSGCPFWATVPPV